MSRCYPEPGRQGKIIDGVFAGMVGSVLEGLPEHGRVRVGLTIFGRPVPGELGYWQIALWDTMTEGDWLHGTGPFPLEGFLRSLPQPPSPRRWCLFACAIARGVWPLLGDERCRRAVET